LKINIDNRFRVISGSNFPQYIFVGILRAGTFIMGNSIIAVVNVGSNRSVRLTKELVYRRKKQAINHLDENLTAWKDRRQWELTLVALKRYQRKYKKYKRVRKEVKVKNDG